MATKTIPFAITITALATALVVGSYHYFSTVSVLEGQINTLEGELTIARAQAVDPASIQEIIGNLKQLPEDDIPAAPDNWIYGSSSARYTLVEMTDTECPYCRDHFPLLKALIESSAGQINAAILHVPALGEASRRQALAIECAGEQGGSDAAWKYTQTVFDKTGGNGTAENVSARTVEFDHGSCTHPHRAAVSAWPDEVLEPGQKTEVFVVTRVPTEVPQSSTRPSLLQ
ncbi:DsbA family protein [Pseudomonas veronii]|uniref:DsbA family protein n=1 Tax=Pseudomonas veronii TaxID=76761 RepID=UPI0021CC5194|nr:thioredoxin domain-containing protein [Pseudomonas veronii]